jgi:hydrogenase maturation protease
MAPAAASETALIVRVRLPRALEAIRRQAVRDATQPLPAHVTLLYPFAPPNAMDRRLRSSVAAAIATHAQFSYQLSGPGRWPETLYASVAPEAPFRSLYDNLAAAFPAFPIYGGAFGFVPHVTIAEAASAGLSEIADDPAWTSLPATFMARSVELIVRDAGGWRTRWRFPLRPSVRVRPSVRLLVCGERLRGDDGAAIRAVEMLSAEARALACIIEAGQLSVEALLDVPEGVAVVVADAAVGVAPGVVVTLPLDEVARSGGAVPASSHSLPPDQVLALAAELRGSLPPGSFVGIGGAEFGFGEELSAAVQSGLGAFARALADEIGRLAAE